MSYGWAGQILRVDLTKGKAQKQPTADYCKDFIGGRGINTKILYDEVGPNVRPLDPENRLLFGTGPLTATLAPASSRVDIQAKSPVTGFEGLSGIGGFWGAELKFAGYDHIVVYGKAEKPVYLWINNDEVEIRNASSLWGQTTFETQKTLFKELGPEVKTVCIGPAGENLVTFASIVHELGNGAGRTGMGAVMGSKNLKAITARGTKPIKIAKPKEFLELCGKTHKMIRESSWYKEYSTVGPDMTSWSKMVMMAGNKKFPEWNWDTTNVKRFMDNYKVSSHACFGCPIGCMQHCAIPEVGFCLYSCQGFTEWGGGVRNDNPKLMGEAFRLCESLGIDVTQTAHITETLMDLYQNGVISAKDTDDIPMVWGDRNAIITMINKIVMRDGVGDLLAEGPLTYAKKIGRGAEDYVMHTKGLTHFDWNLRGVKDVSLAVAVGPRGDHLKGHPEIGWLTFFFDKLPEGKKNELYDKALKIAGTDKALIPLEYEGHPPVLIHSEHEHMVADLMGICTWVTTHLDFPLTSKEMTDLFSASTGMDLTQNAMLKIAERIRNLERAFDVREGLVRTHETLPKRYFVEPVPDGRFKGSLIDREKFEKMKDEYYKLRGWDLTTGAPTAKKLEELNLKYVADDLRKHGKIK